MLHTRTLLSRTARTVQYFNATAGTSKLPNAPRPHAAGAAGAAAAPAATTSAPRLLAQLQRGRGGQGCLVPAAPPARPTALSSMLSVAVASTAAEGSQPLPTHKLACKPGARPPRRPVVLVGCGSYNPPTVMHMRMFELASDELTRLGYDVWGGYLSPVSDAYGKAGLAPARHRLAMCAAGADSCPLTMLDPWEASQGVYTPTLQVLGRIRAQLRAWLAAGGRPAGYADQCTPPLLPSQQPAPEPAAPPEPRVMLLCGADLLSTLTMPGVWEAPEVLLQEYGLVCIVREGTDVGAVMQHEMLSRHKDHVVIVEETVPNTLSSTLVRRELLHGRSVRYLVPDGVQAYLEAHTDVYPRPKL